MKRFFIITGFTVVVVGAVLLTLFVKTTTANADIAAGNQAYTAKNYDMALQHYTTAQSQAPGEAEPVYNAANTYYRQNVLDKAQQTLVQTLAQPQNAIAEFAHFNLGNIAYNAKKFDEAIAQYEAALRLQPGDRDAKYSLELTLQQKQQHDQQQQQNQNQDQKNQQDQQQQNQDQQKQDQQSQQDQQNQSGGQPDQPQKDQQDQQGDQQNQQQGQQGDQKDQPQGQQGDQKEQQQGQQAGQPDQQPNQPAGQAAGAQPQKGLTPEQAKRLLAIIGGNSKTLMEQLQLQYIAPGGNPDKDW